MSLTSFVHPYKACGAAAGPLDRVFTPRWEGLLIPPNHTRRGLSLAPLSWAAEVFPRPNPLGVGCGFQSAWWEALGVHRDRDFERSVRYWVPRYPIHCFFFFPLFQTKLSFSSSSFLCF